MTTWTVEVYDEEGTARRARRLDVMARSTGQQVKGDKCRRRWVCDDRRHASTMMIWLHNYGGEIVSMWENKIEDTTPLPLGVIDS